MVMFSGTTSLLDMCPTSLIHDEDGVRILVYMAGDLGQMRGHCMGVAPWHDQHPRFAEPWADCAEDVCRPCALIVRC